MTSSVQYFGKYRGTVLNNVDPMQMGRIQVLVPDVSGVVPTSWAMPCMPYGGINAGMFAVPLPGTGVWVEFEQGDPDYPIWVGTFWGSAAEVPKLAQTAPAPTLLVNRPRRPDLKVARPRDPDPKVALLRRHSSSVVKHCSTSSLRPASSG